MKDDNYRVTVARDFEPLIPGFMANRRKEIDSLRAALETSDFAQLQRIGHRMKGLGGSYGFERVTQLGKRIEDGARGRDTASVEACVGEYARYLEKVQIDFS